MAAGLLLTLLLLPAARITAQADDPAALVRQAEQAYAKDDMATAAAYYRRAADALKDPDKKVRILMSLALTHHHAKQTPESVAAATEALVLQPDLPFLPDIYPDGFQPIFLEAQQKAVADRERLADERVQQGVVAFNERRYDEARRLFQEALTFRGDDVDAIYHLARTDVWLNRHEDALSGFQEVLRLGDQQPDELEPQTRCLALTNLAFLYHRAKRYDEAERLALQAVEVDPSVAEAWTTLGLARRALGNKEGEAEAFKKAYELDSDDPDVMSRLAQVHIDREEWPEAVPLLKEATKRDGKDPSLWFNLGIAQESLGNVRDALSSFRRVIALDPDNARGLALEAAVRRGNLYFVTKDFEEARDSFKQALRFAPRDAGIHNSLGTVYYKLGRVVDAEKSIREALRLDPTFSAAQENLRRITGQHTP